VCQRDVSPRVSPAVSAPVLSCAATSLFAAETTGVAVSFAPRVSALTVSLSEPEREGGGEEERGGEVERGG